MSFDELPAELLTIVFRNYIRSEGHVEFFMNVIPVCTTWRNIGLSSPSLCKIVDISGKKGSTQLYLPETALESLKWGLLVTEELRMNAVWLNQRVSELLFSGCPNLVSLSFSNCRIHVTTFALVVRHCKKLEMLALDSVTQNDKTISQRTLKPIFLQSGHMLKSVSMSRPMFSSEPECGAVVAMIVGSCPRLEQLKLSTTQDWPSQCVFPVYELRTSCPKLRILSVQGYSFHDWRTVWQSKALQNLEQLELISILNVHAIYNILQNADYLKQLTLKDVCFQYVGISMHRDIKSKSLEKLHLVDVQFDSYDLIGLLQRYRHSLKELTIIDKWTVDRVLLGLLTENGEPSNRAFMKQEQVPSLEVLNLSIPGIQVSVLAQIVRECKRLRKLDTSNCSYLPVAYGWKFDTIEEINLLRDSLPIPELDYPPHDSILCPFSTFDSFRLQL